ncbi:Pol polyprotein [Cricetulus griseus]|nr:Pol polyprotein [Cricetulus griseus]
MILLSMYLNSDEESSMNGQNEKRIFWQASINDKRPQLKVKINNKVISGIVDTGADITIITQKSGPLKRHLTEANEQFLGIGTLSRVQQSINSVVCIGPEVQKEILKSYVADIAINLWGRDLLQQWNTQINIPPVSDTNYVQSLDSRKDLVRHYGKRLPTIYAVQKLGTNDGSSEEPKALPLKWLTDEPIWVEQWPMTSEKLEALEKLVQEQPDAGHIEESTSPWNFPVFVIKKKSGKWRMLTDMRAINKTILFLHISIPPLLPLTHPLPPDYPIDIL